MTQTLECAPYDRPTEAEAREAAYDLLSRADHYVAAQRRTEFGGFDSVGQLRMLAVEAGQEDWVAPHLWAGIRRVRGGAGTALVGTPEQVATLLDEYIAAGIRYFIFSGYPHREEAENVGQTLLPLLRERHALPLRMQWPDNVGTLPWLRLSGLSGTRP